MLSVDRPSSFVSPSLNDIILKSPSHPFPFIATTSRSPSHLWCIPPLIPPSKSPDDLSEMGSLVNWCVKRRWLYSIHSQSWQWRWSCAQELWHFKSRNLQVYKSTDRAVKFTGKTITRTVAISLIKYHVGKQNIIKHICQIANEAHNHDRHNAAPADPLHRGGKMTISSATCDISNNWATPSSWFHPLTHTWFSHGYHQQTSTPLLWVSEVTKVNFA